MRVAPTLYAIALVACGDGGASAPDGGALDASAPDGSALDAQRDAGTNEFAFPLRVPSSVTLACTIDPFTCPTGTVTVEQIDHVCTFDVPGRDVVVYVQANPTAPSPLGSTAIYGDVDGYAHDRVSSTTTPVPAAYDYGGNHHNDFIDVTVEAQRYRLYHSSFGFGFRACHPPDCVQKVDAAGAVTEDGCTSARSLPAVCVRLTDAVIPPLTDTFARCPGDPTSP